MRPELKYGLLTGATVSAWIALEYSLGWHTTHAETGEITGYFSSLVPLIFIYFLLREKQAASESGRLTLGQGIAAGLVTSLFGAVIVYAFMLAYSQWINPFWVDNALAHKVTMMRAKAIDEAEIRRAITFYRQLNSPSGLIATTLLGMTATGGIFSMVVTLFLRFQQRDRRTL